MTNLGVIRNLLYEGRVFHAGDIKFTLAEGWKHFERKCAICWVLACNNLPFYTEAVFKGSKGRADILTVVDGRPVAIEIINSEDERSIEMKKLKYPCDVVEIKVDEFFRIEMIC